MLLQVLSFFCPVILSCCLQSFMPPSLWQLLFYICLLHLLLASAALLCYSFQGSTQYGAPANLKHRNFKMPTLNCQALPAEVGCSCVSVQCSPQLLPRPLLWASLDCSLCFCQQNQDLHGLFLGSLQNCGWPLCFSFSSTVCPLGYLSVFAQIDTLFL